MNKEEIKELINDPIIKVKVAESTNILMDLYELGFNNGFKLSQSQLDIANKKLDKYNNQEKQTTIFIDTEDMEERYGTQLYIEYLEKYKNAWEELKNDNSEIIEYGNRAVKDCKLYKNKKMYLLEQKYNLEVNE